MPNTGASPSTEAPLALAPAEQRTLEVVLAWTVLLAATADSVLTYIGLRHLDGEEGAPFTLWMIEEFGLAWGLVVRTLVMLSLFAIVWRFVHVRGLRLFGLIVVSVINVAVIGWNLAVMWTT